MRALQLIAACIVGLTCGNSLPAAEPFDQLDDYVKDAMKKWQVPGLAMAVVKDGEVVLVRGYGVTKVGGSRPVDGETVFPLASITKNFTATALALLVEDGKVDWDDPVTKHLPNVRFSDDSRTEYLTIRDLLCHRTGLERGDLLPRRGDVSRSDVIHRIRYLEPVAGFRSKWGYNNLMYILAGEVVSEVSGTAWEKFVTERLFKRLKMTSTYALGDQVRSENRATSHGLVDGKVVAVESLDRDDVIAPAGSTRSSAQDMAQWLLACLGDGQDGTRLLKPEILREMQSLQMTIPVTGQRGKNVYAARFYGSGLGWTVLDYRGRKFCDHAGSAGTMMAIMPEERIGVVVLTNVGWSNLSGMLMYDVFDAYLLGPEKAWDRSKWDFWMAVDPHPSAGRLRDLQEAESKRQEGTKPTLPLAALAGRYECDLYGDLVVSLEQGKLLITFGKNGPVATTHWEGNTFYARSPVASDPDVDWLVSFYVGDGIAHSVSLRRIGWHETMPTFKRSNLD
jgi:CubicO group peptidase (beta-lactamase class C family)